MPRDQASFPEKEKNLLWELLLPPSCQFGTKPNEFEGGKKILANYKHNTSINTTRIPSWKNASVTKNPMVGKRVTPFPKGKKKYKDLRCHETYP